jgi:hypothetical protein
VVLVRLTVLGACGAWPEAGQACSGYLVEHDGFRLLIDAGYAIVPRLLERVFDAWTCLLPHWVPNAGLRLAEQARCSPTPETAALTRESPAWPATPACC